MRLLKNPAFWVVLVGLVFLSALSVYFSIHNHELELKAWDTHVRLVGEGKLDATMGVHRIEIDGNVEDEISRDPRLSSAGTKFIANPGINNWHKELNAPGVFSPQTEYLFTSGIQGGGSGSRDEASRPKKSLAYTIQAVPKFWSFHRPLGVSLLYVSILAILWFTTFSADRGRNSGVSCAHFLAWGGLTGVWLWTASTIMSVSTLPPGWGWLRLGGGLGLGVLNASYLFVFPGGRLALEVLLERSHSRFQPGDGGQPGIEGGVPIPAEIDGRPPSLFLRKHRPTDSPLYRGR